MEIEIRKANLKDLREILNLNLLLFKKEHKDYDKFLDLKWTFGKETRKYFKDRLKRGSVFVALADKKIAGYLEGSVAEGEDYRILPKVATLGSTLVLEKYRGLGMGTKLCREFFKWCKDNKVKIVKVEAYAQNTKAIELYRSLGFKDLALSLEKHL